MAEGISGEMIRCISTEVSVRVSKAVVVEIFEAFFREESFLKQFLPLKTSHGEFTEVSIEKILEDFFLIGFMKESLYEFIPEEIPGEIFEGITERIQETLQQKSQKNLFTKGILGIILELNRRNS